MKKTRLIFLGTGVLLIVILGWILSVRFDVLANPASDFKYEISDDTITITGLNAQVDQLVIPPTIDHHPVKAIGPGAFINCITLRSVKIPDSVTIIGEGAFTNCSSLESVRISNNVSTIETWTFAFCNILSVQIPNSVTTIKNGAFTACPKICSIKIPKSVTAIGERAFAWCASLNSIEVDTENPSYKSIDGVLFSKDGTCIHYYPLGRTDPFYTIPSSVATIRQYSFPEFSTTSAVNIPSSVTMIAEGAFALTSLRSITVDSGNPSYKSIDGVLFSKDGTLLHCYPPQRFGTSYTIPSGTTTLAKRAFYNNIRLKVAEIPDSVTAIGEESFARCINLSSINIPNSVVTIGKEAFASCMKLSPIEIPVSVKTVGMDIFLDCDIPKKQSTE